MWKTRILLYGGVFIAAYLLLTSGISGAMTALLVLGTFTSVYMLISQHQRKKRLEKLNKVLDPELFILSTEEQMRNTPKWEKKTKTLLFIDLAVGYMASGENDKALECLNQVDEKKLAVKNNSKLMYNINRIMCLLRVGQIEEAEQLFDAELEDVSTSQAYVRQGVYRVLCELYFYLERFGHFREESEDLINGNPPLSLRAKIDLKYRIAQVAEMDGDMEKATELYEYIAEKGNKLWVAQQAREFLAKDKEV